MAHARGPPAALRTAGGRVARAQRTVLKSLNTRW